MNEHFAEEEELTAPETPNAKHLTLSDLMAAIHSATDRFERSVQDLTVEVTKLVNHSMSLKIVVDSLVGKNVDIEERLKRHEQEISEIKERLSTLPPYGK